MANTEHAIPVDGTAINTDALRSLQETTSAGTVQKEVVVLAGPQNSGSLTADVTANGLKVDIGASVALTTSPVAATAQTKANVTMTGSSVTAQAANASRKGWKCFNDSGVVVYVDESGGTASSTSFTVKLQDGDYYEMPSPITTGAITALGASGSLRVVEIT